jgi:Mg-chelatase subunit ChlD
MPGVGRWAPDQKGVCAVAGTLMRRSTAEAVGQKIFPVFLVVDASYSMEGQRLATAQTLAPELIDACLEDPSITDKVRV